MTLPIDQGSAAGHSGRQPGPDSAHSVPDLSIIIVSFNSAKFLPACLRSIAAGAGGLSYEVILVDNSSSDGTVAWVAMSMLGVRVIANTLNEGFARACNSGLQIARGHFLLLLNPDTVLDALALEHTANYLRKRSKIAAASCKVVMPDGRIDRSCKREFPNLWDAFTRFTGLSRVWPQSRLWARYDAAYLDDDLAQEVPLIDGCFMMIRREALDDFGFLDERFFMYAEEMDWCRRAHNAGWSIGYEPAGRVVHIKGATTQHHTFRMLYHFHRSMALYYWKHSRWRWMGTLVVIPGLLLRFTALMILNACRKNRHVSGGGV